MSRRPLQVEGKRKVMGEKPCKDGDWPSRVAVGGHGCVTDKLEVNRGIDERTPETSRVWKVFRLSPGSLCCKLLCTSQHTSPRDPRQSTTQ